MNDIKEQVQARITYLRDLTHRAAPIDDEGRSLMTYLLRESFGATHHDRMFADLASEAVNVLPGVLDWSQETLDGHDNIHGVCKTCNAVGRFVAWPCPPFLSVARALGVQGATQEVGV